MIATETAVARSIPASCWTPALGRMVAALFVETDGCYFGVPGVDPWDIERDARKYNGPHPVVCHPPCQRWGRYWHGSPNAPHQFRKGEDHGCFAVALTAVRNYGGVLEHPAHSHAWAWFGLAEPPAIGWGRADNFGGMTCYVEQGHYGHISRKGPGYIRSDAERLTCAGGHRNRRSIPLPWLSTVTRRPAVSA